jgi:hypothetical protein
MNGSILIGFCFGVVAASCLAGVWDGDINIPGSAILGGLALICIVAAFILTFWDTLRWVV